jgi:acetyltransferase-like isoleucine patch superfamily enzyme
LERKIWIIGSSGFALKIGAQFAKIPGVGNTFGGFIDSRPESLNLVRVSCDRIGLKADTVSPEAVDFQDSQNRFLFGVGDTKFKKDFFCQHKIPFESLHRFEQTPDISEFSDTKPGIYWGCAISANTTVGYSCFIDRNSVIGHDVVVGNFCHIAVGVIVGGGVTIGDATYIHSGAIIGNDITIGEGSIIGVGAVVVRNLPPGSKVIAPKSHSIS